MVEISEITNETEWEDLMSSIYEYPIFFQSYKWGELEKKRGKTVYNLAFFENNKLIALALCVLVKAKRGQFLHVRGGPVLNWDSFNKANIISNKLLEFSKKLNCSFFRISPNIYKNEYEKQDWFLKLGYKKCQMHDVDAEVTWLLDLNNSEDNILKSMRDSHRYLIKKALKNEDLTIIKSANVNDINEFWNIYIDTVKRQKWKAYSFEYIKQEFEEFIKSNQILLFLAKYREKYIASSLFIYYKNQVFYHHSGSLTEFRNIPAMYLIHWESIIEAKLRGMNKYNFFGIARNDDKKHPWAGLTLFKKGFGGYKSELIHALDYPIKPTYYITHYFEKLERILRGY